MEHLLHDEYFWLTLSFILFIGLIFKFGVPVINKTLDGKIEEIKKDIQTAESLRIEAQEMLAQYQRKQRDAMKEAEKIIADARNGAKKVKENAELEINEMMARREAQLKSRLERMENDAINHIKKLAGEIAMAATLQIITEKLDKTHDQSLVEDTLSNLKAHIH